MCGSQEPNALINSLLQITTVFTVSYHTSNTQILRFLITLLHLYYEKVHGNAELLVGYLCEPV